MQVKQLISELSQFPPDLDVAIFRDKEECRIKDVGIVINDGQPQCGIIVR